MSGEVIGLSGEVTAVVDKPTLCAHLNVMPNKNSAASFLMEKLLVTMVGDDCRDSY